METNSGKGDSVNYKHFCLFSSTLYVLAYDLLLGIDSE